MCNACLLATHMALPFFRPVHIAVKASLEDNNDPIETLLTFTPTFCCYPSVAVSLLLWSVLLQITAAADLPLSAYQLCCSPFSTLLARPV